MKPEHWLITPLSAIVVGSVAMVLQPNQRLAPLIGSSVGALAAAPLLTRKEHQQKRDWQALRADLTALQNSLATESARVSEQLAQQYSLLQNVQQQLNAPRNLPSAAAPEQTLDTLNSLQRVLESHSNDLALIKAVLEHSPPKEHKEPKTAILYDIENLVFLQGQRLDPQQVSERVRLDNILETVNNTVPLGKVLVQRAYGNWMNHVLQTFSPQLDQLKIERVAVYGRNRDQRNAADIQLALDAIDTIHQYPEINTFVLVSGDGGFGSIALKLRDYGKTVIGCAYRDSASDSLQRVCHHFILLDTPFSQLSRSASNQTSATNNPQAPRQQRTIPIPEISYPEGADSTDIKNLELAQINELIDYYASDPNKQEQLQRGIDFNIFSQDLRQLIPRLDSLRFGFSKLSELIGFITEQNNLSLCVAVSNTRRRAILCWRDRLPEDCIIRSHQPESIHTVSIYRSIFANKLAGDPLLRQVGELLINNRPRHVALRIVKNLIVEHLRSRQLPVNINGIKCALANYIKANVLLKSENIDILSLNPQIRTFADLVEMTQNSFRQVVKDRLATLGEVIDEAVFAQAVPFRTARTENSTTSEGTLPNG
ncbi:NYN domain-containing protein [Parathermosynechococcus lividus]